LLNKLDFLIVT